MYVNVENRAKDNILKELLKVLNYVFIEINEFRKFTLTQRCLALANSEHKYKWKSQKFKLTYFKYFMKAIKNI